MKTFTSSIALVLSGLVVSGCVWRVRSDSETASNTGATAPPQGTPAPNTPPATSPPAPSTPAPAPATSSPTPAPVTPQPGRPPRLTPVPPAAPPARTPPVLSGPVPPGPAPAKPPGDYHHKPAPAPPSKGKGGPDASKFDTAIGMAAGMKAGAPLAIWVWADAPGEKWHIRSTTLKPDLHKFTGRIFVNEGSLLDARGTALEGGVDRFQAGPREITVAFETNGAIDGVDFTLSGSECVRFDFLVDGKAQPLLINIGPRPYHPGSADFRLCR